MLHPDSRDPGVLQPGPAWSLGERRSWPALGAAPVCPPACWPPPAPARAVPAPARAVPATAGSALPVGGGGGLLPGGHLALLGGPTACLWQSAQGRGGNGSSPVKRERPLKRPGSSSPSSLM